MEFPTEGIPPATHSKATSAGGGTEGGTSCFKGSIQKYALASQNEDRLSLYLIWYIYIYILWCVYIYICYMCNTLIYIYIYYTHLIIYVSIAITTTHPMEKLHTSSNVAPVLGGQRCPKRSDEVAPLGARSGGGNGGSHGLHHVGCNVEKIRGSLQCYTCYTCHGVYKYKIYNIYIYIYYI